jgi:hypothetical protein
MSHEPHDLFSIFEARRLGDEIELRVEPLGTIVHDGILVACDPFSGTPTAFARQFPAGSHAVEALVQRRNNDERVALARVVFSPAVPVTFEHATRGDEDIRMLAPGQHFGYGVDAGTGCFAAADCLLEDPDDSDALAAQFEADRRITWGTGRSHPRGDGHGLVAFSSGYGDGIYASYVGLDAAGNPVCLVTDFRCIDVLLPSIPDDPAFRRAHAKKMYARMKDHVHDLAGPGRGIAYEAAADLAGSPADAVGVVATLLGDLRATRDEMARDLYTFALARILEAPSAQHVAAPLIGGLDDRALERLLVDARETDPSWFESVRSLWSRPALREAILKMERRAARTATDPITFLHAVECLDAKEPRLVQLALTILGDIAQRTGTPLDEGVLVRVRAIAERGPAGSNERACVVAFGILQAAGDDLERFLTTGPAASRLAAALSLRRGDAARADAVLVGLAHDPAVALDLRFSASESIRDVDARVAALLAVGLAGHHAAPIQLRYTGGPAAIAALDRLVAEGPDETVRSQAVRYAQIARELEANRAR